MPISLYEANETRAYLRLFEPGAVCGWLIHALENYAVASALVAKPSSILDLACGIGSFCWRMSSIGCIDVLGIDLSCTQIEACDRVEEDLRIPPRFEVRDACRLSDDASLAERFDLVNASWLYDTAKDERVLLAMARGAFHCLRPGGYHLGIDLGFNIRASSEAEWRDFGIALMVGRAAGVRPRNGEVIRARVGIGPRTHFGPNNCLETDVAFYSEATYRRVFAEAGFAEVHFIPPESWSPEQLGLHGESIARWHQYATTNPEMIGFSARKPA